MTAPESYRKSLRERLMGGQLKTGRDRRAVPVNCDEPDKVKPEFSRKDVKESSPFSYWNNGHYVAPKTQREPFSYDWASVKSPAASSVVPLSEEKYEMTEKSRIDNSKFYSDKDVNKVKKGSVL